MNNISNLLSSNDLDGLTKALETLETLDPHSNGPRPGTTGELTIGHAGFTPETPPIPPTPPSPPTPPPPLPPNVALNQILDRIDSVTQNYSYIVDSVKSIHQMSETGWDGCTDTAQIVINGVVEVIKAREQTNQKALDLLEKMYTDHATERPVYNAGANTVETLAGLGINIPVLLTDLPGHEKMSFIRTLLGMDASGNRQK